MNGRSGGQEATAAVGDAAVTACDGTPDRLTAVSSDRLTAPSFTWRLLVEPDGRPGCVNMAIDQSLLEEADRSHTAQLRLYRWNPPCLSFGRHEPTRRYDRALLERLGLDVVRRPTGGRAVWHEYEVTYAVAAPIAAFGSLRAAYRAIHERLAAALRSLGADASLAPDRLTARPPDRPGTCFESPVGGEVLVWGRKLVGSAQVRRARAFLQHGSILLDGSQEIIQAVSRQTSDVRRQTSGVRGATTLSTALGRRVTFEEVAQAIIGAWGSTLAPTAPVRPRPPLSASPPDRLTAFYLDPAWTWRR